MLRRTEIIIVYDVKQLFRTRNAVIFVRAIGFMNIRNKKFFEKFRNMM